VKPAGPRPARPECREEFIYCLKVMEP
jgi:hypothetical protein